jgi:hypothetical protein
MCRFYETLWTFKTKNFTIAWEVTDCDCSLDLSWDDTGETLENLQSGLWTAFDSKMAVYYRGEEIAADYLGQSIYENPRDFRDHIGMNAKGHGSYFSDMVREAVREARAHFKDAPRLRTAA